MAFIYLLLSLIASALQEILASVIQSRSANLLRGLRSLLSGDQGLSGKPLVERVYDHGLVRGLYQSPDKDFEGHADAAAIRKRYNLFAGVRLRLRKICRINPPGIADDVNKLFLPSYIPSRVFALAMRDLLNEPKPFGWDSLRNIEHNLQGLRDRQPENKAAEALLALLADAAGRPDRLQRNLENWYNDAMDRVSGWYKKYAQNLLLIIGLILAIAFNVDSLRLGRALWMDKDARTGLATAASGYLAKHPDAPAQKPESTQLDISALTANLKGTVQAFDEVTQTSLLPVGWRHWPKDYRAFVSATPGEAIFRLLLAVIGWSITAAALSLGASFWFDTLNKFMIVRGTIKPQEKSQPEGSKD